MQGKACISRVQIDGRSRQLELVEGRLDQKWEKGSKIQLSGYRLIFGKADSTHCLPIETYSLKPLESWAKGQVRSGHFPWVSESEKEKLLGRVYVVFHSQKNTDVHNYGWWSFAQEALLFLVAFYFYLRNGELKASSQSELEPQQGLGWDLTKDRPGVTGRRTLLKSK